MHESFVFREIDVEELFTTVILPFARSILPLLSSCRLVCLTGATLVAVTHVDVSTC